MVGCSVSLFVHCYLHTFEWTAIKLVEISVVPREMISKHLK